MISFWHDTEIKFIADRSDVSSPFSQDPAAGLLMANFANSTISLRNGEFTDVSAEARFAHSQLKLTQVQLRTALIFCSAVYIAFFVTDISVLGYTADAFRLLLARILVALTAAAGCWLLYRKPDSVAVSRLVACICEIVGMGAFLFIQWTRPSETPWTRCRSR
jgi:hypothetical protein